MAANALLIRFKYESLLNQDQAGRRIILLGHISNEPALLLVERGAFTTSPGHLSSLTRLLAHVTPLGANDIYHWYLANSLPSNTLDEPSPPDLKINLIYPCTPKHIAKYSFQPTRSVTETPQIYTDKILPYITRQREAGRLDWVFNILEGRAEQENVLFRSSLPETRDNFLLLPDLNWDRQTISSLHCLALVERRDLWSVRDLTKNDVPWLRHLIDTLTDTVASLYEGVERDMLKLYVHYQPTYYHFHVHVVHVSLDPSATQAVGKALGLRDVVGMLEVMAEGKGMRDVELTYTVGEASELWREIFGPLKEARGGVERDEA